MTQGFTRSVTALRRQMNRFDAASVTQVRKALEKIRALPLQQCQALLDYHEALLFLSAHPADRALLAMVNRGLRRLAQFLRQQRPRHIPLLSNEGLPYAALVCRFSHDCVQWLLQHPQCTASIDSYQDATADLNAILRLTLPSLERSHTTAGLDNAELLDALQVPQKQRLAFIAAQLQAYDAQPYVKDHLYDALGIFLRITPRSAAFSRAFNRLPRPSVFFHTDALRQFDAPALMNSALPAARVLDRAGLAQAILVLKNTMALTVRETDPGTYLDPGSLRIYDLERGISVALFGMTPPRQLPLESYVGFTAFKNGLPIAYGGSWLLGPGANFGMNIFEPYRGGESGYLMCQIIRTYRQTFGIDYFEVDAHQFGLDNPDGIASGAFWFYYRYGFRPLAGDLAALAINEKQRMATQAGYRSSTRTLLRFTQSNVALNFAAEDVAPLGDLAAPVTQMVAKTYGADRRAAENACISEFRSLTKVPKHLNADQLQVCAEVALLAAALEIKDAALLRLLARMVTLKPTDLFGYQSVLRQFLIGHRQGGDINAHHRLTQSG